MSTVAVLGLGLIGGSIARDLSEAGHDVIGYDRSPDVLDAALAAHVLEKKIGPDLHGLEQAGTVVFAVPVRAAPGLMESALPRLRDASLITDVGSTKRAICRQAERLGLGDRFVGAHPFAGDHRAGWTASRAGLFRDARVFLCPVHGTTAAVLDRARKLWQDLGARTEVTSAAEHDEKLAWSSHLPQLASSALALAFADAGIPASELGRGGHDVTRLAASDPELWTGIVLENSEHAARTLAALESCLAMLRSQVESQNHEAIEKALRRAHEWSSRDPESGLSPGNADFV